MLKSSVGRQREQLRNRANSVFGLSTYGNYTTVAQYLDTLVGWAQQPIGILPPLVPDVSWTVLLVAGPEPGAHV